VPLNTIRLGLDSVSPTEINLDTTYVFGCLDKAANSISDVLNDVLSYQKVIEGKLELNRQPFDVEKILWSCYSEFSAAAAVKESTLTYVKDFDVPQELVGDIILLRQVLSNFLSNAIKFTKRGGSVSLRARLVSLSFPRSQRDSIQRSLLRVRAPPRSSPGDSCPRFLRSKASSISDSFNSPLSTSSFPTIESALRDEAQTSEEAATGGEAKAAGADVFDSQNAKAVVEFSVVDTGCGISSLDQVKLFEAFSQLRAGDLQSDRGSGLGMPLSKHLVELMRGTIKVQSQLGKGSTFSCTVCALFMSCLSDKFR